ncbi:lipopolysaccharide core biosynthesis protein [Pseudomonas sp. AA-38]|uniref:lipopolysaccharide core biosynthesis protein n=1 Tax=Pseudomonas sp. AA-38 TaxID=3028807 RepID=UPI0023FA3AAD|nr:lipopolysaccharide core biosynthesis protein [Pseudomonas sp. AA-38]
MGQLTIDLQDDPAIELEAYGRRPLDDLRRLKGRYSGPVFIVTSGPSVADFPIERYGNIPMMAVNGSIACFPSGIDPFFFLCDDRSVAAGKSDLVAQGVRRAAFSFMGPDALESLAEREPEAIWQSRLFVAERVNRWRGVPRVSDRRFAWQQRNNGDYVIQRALFSQKRSRIGFSRNFPAGYFSCRTIAYAAIQLAYYLGFNRIFMVGMDLQASLGHFYDPKGTRVPSRLDEDYEDLILPHFQWMSRQVLGRDFQVFNLSTNSRLPADVLPKIDLAELDRLLAVTALREGSV